MKTTKQGINHFSNINVYYENVNDADNDDEQGKLLKIKQNERKKTKYVQQRQKKIQW